MSDDRLPTALWIEAHTRRLNAEGIPYYTLHTGAYAAGTVLLKLRDKGACRLLIQQRDLEGELGWTNATKDETLDDSRADEYIARATARDPDLWVIEIEAPENPFGGKIF